MDATTLILSAGIQALVGFGVWFSIRRPIDQLSADNRDMRNEITQLRDQRIVSLDRSFADLNARFSGAVPLSLCEKQHRELARGIDEFRGAVIDLAHVQSELKGTASFVSEVNGRVMGLISDVGSVVALEKRVERLEDRG